MKKMKCGDGVMGITIDGIEWVTNRFWLYRSDSVKLPPEGIVCFPRGEAWATGDRSILKPDQLKDVLAAHTESRPAKISDIVLSELPKDEYRARMIVAVDKSTYAIVRESYLINDCYVWTPKIIGPSEQVSFWKGNEMMAIVFPLLRLEIRGDLEEARACVIAQEETDRDKKEADKD